MRNREMMGNRWSSNEYGPCPISRLDLHDNIFHHTCYMLIPINIEFNV